MGFKMSAEISTEITESTELSVASLDDVRSWGWSPLRLAQELNDFRARSISELAGVSQRPAEQWSNIFFEYPDTWRILTTGPEKIVGYWQIIPLTQTAKEMNLRGQSTVRVPVEDIFYPINQPGWYDVLIYSISIDPQFRNLFSGMLLANSMIRAFTDLARRGIMFRQVIAGIVSRYGRLMNVGLGFDLKYVVDHEVVGQIYAGDLPSMLRRPIAKESSDVTFRTLCELYAAHEEPSGESEVRSQDENAAR